MSAVKPKAQKIKGSEANLWLSAYVVLPAITAVVSLVLIFSEPSEGVNTFLLGISLTRWILVGLFLILLVGFSSLIWIKFRNRSRWEQAQERFVSLISKRSIYIVLIGITILTGVATFYAILLTFKFTDQFIQVRLGRLLPLSIWLFTFSLQNAVVLPRLSQNINTGHKVSTGVVFTPVLVTLGFLLLIALFVWTSRIGLNPDKVGWDNPGAPLLAEQVTSAWLIGILLWGVITIAEKRFGWKISCVDVVAAIVIWVVAVLSWQSQPLTPTFFSPAPRAPSFEFFPYSDAATHDIGSQNLIVGSGLPDVIEKPLYSFFLAVIHLFAGQSYSSVVNAQILVLALLPVVLYFLGARFHHRLSGGLLAFTTIFREVNSIALSGEIRVSHSKLLMTDLPTALAIAALTLLVMRWLHSARSDLKWPLFVGGAAGLLALLRSQAIIFVPVLLILSLWHAEPIWRNRIAKAFVLLLGFVLALFPWLLRNYQVTGQFGYSQPLQAAYLAKQYSLTPEKAIFDVPDGTPITENVSIGFSRVLAFTLEHPGEVAGFVSAHFFHNEVSSFLTLPMRFDFADKLVTFYNLRPYWIGLEGRLWAECCSLEAYLTDSPYWQNWDGAFPPEAVLPILVNLAFIAIGVGKAWKRLGWLALVPIVIHVFYNLSTAVARVSGWRLNLPVDWVLLMFYCIGIGQVTLWVLGYLIRFSHKKSTNLAGKRKEPVPHWRKQGLVPLGAAILAAGALLPLSEVIIPQRYGIPTAEYAQSAWNKSDLSNEAELVVADFLAQSNADILAGRALYPRFYSANEGEPGGIGSPFNQLPFPRIAFWLVGSRTDLVAIPLRSTANFPNAADVLVIGCDEETFFEAHAVLFSDQTTADLITDSNDTFVCD